MDFESHPAFGKDIKGFGPNMKGFCLNIKCLVKIFKGMVNWYVKIKGSGQNQTNLRSVGSVGVLTECARLGFGGPHA